MSPCSYVVSADTLVTTLTRAFSRNSSRKGEYCGITHKMDKILFWGQLDLLMTKFTTLGRAWSGQFPSHQSCPNSLPKSDVLVVKLDRSITRPPPLTITNPKSGAEANSSSNGSKNHLTATAMTPNWMTWLPDGYSQILYIVVCVCPFGLEGLWLRYATPPPSNPAQSKERKWSNFATWQPCWTTIIEKREREWERSNPNVACQSSPSSSFCRQSDDFSQVPRFSFESYTLICIPLFKR